MMIQINGTVQGVPLVARVLAKLEDQAMDAVLVGMGRGVLLGQSIVRGNARGRPGPRAVTGDFNRSIVGEVEGGGSVINGQIGTNAAQARRLEYGFYGTDALGRNYNQPPYPYLGPSVPKVKAAVEAEIAKQIGRQF
jgi:hypothetical protein